MPTFLNNVDLAGNELQNPVIHKLAAAPAGPAAGLVYYNTTVNKFYGYTGSAWVDLGATGTGDVAGPAGATDGHVAAFDGATGLLLKDSGHALSEYQAVSQKGAANGYAGLDAGGKVPSSQLPSTVTGGMQYKGTLDASGGSYPADPETGDYYVVSAAGTISGTAYAAGDWAAYNGASWDKIDNTDAVSSVAGRTGAVTLSASDISDFDTEVGNNTTVAAKADAYAADVGDGSATEFTLTHSLGTRDVIVMIRENASPYALALADVEMYSTSQVKVRFASAPASSQYRVIVMG